MMYANDHDGYRPPRWRNYGNAQYPSPNVTPFNGTDIGGFWTLVAVKGPYGIAALFDVNRALADRSDKSIGDLFPVKNLTGIEGQREVEIRRRDFNQLHSCHRLTRIKHR